MKNDGRWSRSDSSWIAPDLVTLTVVWGETQVEGTELFASQLSRPPAVQDYCEDIAVLRLALFGSATLQPIR